MRRKLNWGMVTAFAAIAVVSGGVGVFAQPDKESIITQRREAMKALGKSMGAVKGFVDGKNDLAQAQEGAGNIVKTASKIADLFPSGTSMTDFPGKKTGAKPAIWSEHDKFLAAQEQLVSESQKLVEVVKSGDKAQIAAQFSNVGKNGCSNCHNSFREKLD